MKAIGKCSKSTIHSNWAQKLKPGKSNFLNSSPDLNLIKCNEFFRFLITHANQRAQCFSYHTENCTYILFCCCEYDQLKMLAHSAQELQTERPDIEHMLKGELLNLIARCLPAIFLPELRLDLCIVLQLLLAILDRSLVLKLGVD